MIINQTLNLNIFTYIPAHISSPAFYFSYPSLFPSKYFNISCAASSSFNHHLLIALDRRVNREIGKHVRAQRDQAFILLDRILRCFFMIYGRKKIEKHLMLHTFFCLILSTHVGIARWWCRQPPLPNC